MTYSNLRAIKKSLWIILDICFVLEMILFPSLDNLVGGIVTYASTYTYFKLIFNNDIIMRRPVSFIATVYLFLFMYLPLPVTLIDGNSMSHDLINPVKTYFLQLFYVITVLCSFIIADHWCSRHNGLYKFLDKCGYFIPPTNIQLWILGIIGILIKFFIFRNQFGDETQSGLGTLKMFSILVYCPICIYFKDIFGKDKPTLFEKRTIWAYMIALSILFISSNSRGLMLSPFVIWVFSYIIQQIYYGKSKNFFSLKKIILGLLAVLIVMGPVTDMGIAMLITRNERSNMDFSELLKRTLYTFQDKELLDRAKAMEQAIESQDNGSLVIGDWNESYVSNIFFNRLCNYRVADESIYYADVVGYSNKKMQNVFVTDILLAPIGPIARLLTNENKANYDLSPMDYLFYMKSGYGIGGHRVGGDVGLGLATFGYFYYPLLLITLIIVFILLNSVCVYYSGIINISFYTLILAYSEYFLKLQVGRGLESQVSYLIWGFWFTNLCYIIIYKLIRMITPK